MLATAWTVKKSGFDPEGNEGIGGLWAKGHIIWSVFGSTAWSMDQRVEGDRISQQNMPFRHKHFDLIDL